MIHEELKEVGTRLKKYLAYKDMKANHFGKRCGLQGVQIYNILKGKKYGMDKFLLIAEELKDINLNWLIWNEGGEHNMFRSSTNEQTTTKEHKTPKIEMLQEEIKHLKAKIDYQDMTIDAYKRGMDIATASNDDLRKLIRTYENISKKSA